MMDNGQFDGNGKIAGVNGESMFICKANYKYIQKIKKTYIA